MRTDIFSCQNNDAGICSNGEGSDLEQTIDIVLLNMDPEKLQVLTGALNGCAHMLGMHFALSRWRILLFDSVSLKSNSVRGGQEL